MYTYIRTLLHYLSVHRWPGLLWTTLILIACLSPSSDIPDGPPLPGFDKVVHIGLFAVWAGLWTGVRDQAATRLLPFGEVFLTGAALGLGIEILQGASGLGRSFEWLDLAADCTGAVLGFLGRRYLMENYLPERNSTR